MNDEVGAWLTYAEAGDRLGVSPDAVRTKALRKRWRNQIGIDGRARIWHPEDERSPDDRPVIGRSSPERENERSPVHPPIIGRSSRGHRPIDPALVIALESHIKTLQAENEALKQDVTATRADLSAHVETLKAQLAGAEGKANEHVVTLKADVERQEALLAAERERADKAIAGLEALLRTESERADRGLAAFEQLALRLEELAQARRPWWRRLVG
jgi:hypothetical protein